MNAAQLKFMYGDLLLGRVIVTEAIGEWPGGIADIIEIAPDEGIAFQVRHKTVKNPENGKLWEIGVLEYETVILIGPEPHDVAPGRAGSSKPCPDTPKRSKTIL